MCTPLRGAGSGDWGRDCYGCGKVSLGAARSAALGGTRQCTSAAGELSRANGCFVPYLAPGKPRHPPYQLSAAWLEEQSPQNLEVQVLFEVGGGIARIRITLQVPASQA